MKRDDDNFFFDFLKSFRELYSLYLRMEFSDRL